VRNRNKDVPTKADSVSAPVPSELPEPDSIREDEDFTVQISRKKKNNSLKVTSSGVSPDAINTSLLPSPTPQPSTETSRKSQSPGHYLTSPRDKIPPVVIHYNFEGDMTRLNKDFHATFQPLGFTTYRMKSGIACQTSTLKDYLNLQKFLKDNNVPFNLLKSANSKPYKVVIKGIPPTTPPNVIQDELQAIGLNVQNVIPMTAWRDKSPLSMHIIELDNIPQSQKILEIKHLCYIKITIEPYRTRTVPPQCARCQRFYHVAASCMAPPACGYCAGPHCSWDCTARFQPNFVPTCALCKIGEHSTKFRGCPFFQDLMEKEGRLNRNKPTHTKQKAPPPRTPVSVGKAGGPLQPPAFQRPPSHSNFSQNLPAQRVNNAWNRPLVFGNQATTPTFQTLVQPNNIPLKYQFRPTEVHMPSVQPPTRDPRLANPVVCTCKAHPTNFSMHPHTPTSPKKNSEPTTGPSSPSSEVVRDENPNHLQPTQSMPENRPTNRTHPKGTASETYVIPQASGKKSPQQPVPTNQFPHHKRLGDVSTEHQTQEFVNIIRNFNPSFSFQCLLQSLTAMLLQFMQHPYESALPVIFNTFLSHLLGFNYGKFQ
jgi:hypothetical protein